MKTHLKNSKKLLIVIFAITALMTLRLDATEIQTLRLESAPVAEPFIPDSAVNNVYFLDRPKAIKQACEKYNPTWNNDADLPYAIMSNSKGDEYLKFIFFCGDYIYHAHQFEIGYVANGENIVKTDDESFVTSCGIRLGTTKNDLMERIGEDYSQINIGDSIVIHYQIGSIIDTDGVFIKTSFDIVESGLFAFLVRHRWEETQYNAYYWIVNDKVVKIKFGGEAP